MAANVPKTIPKQEDVHDAESDEYLQYLFGDRKCCLPGNLRMSKDWHECQRLCHLLLEGISESEIFSSSVKEIITSAKYFCLINSGGNCWALLRYSHVENASTVSDLIKTLLPTVTVHRTGSIIDQAYREFGELQCKENHMLSVLDEAAGQSRDVYNGILLIDIPDSLTTAQIEPFFKSCKDLFIVRDSVRPDGHVEKLDHTYACVLYESAEETEEAFKKHPTEQIIVDGHGIDLVNYCAIRDILNGDPCTYTKVLPDKTRSALINVIPSQHTALRLIHHHLSRFASTGKGPGRKQRKEMTARKKDIARRMASAVKALTVDTNRRNSNKVPIKDTAEQKKLLANCLDEGRNILGREMFNNYMTKTAPPVPGVRVAPRINTAGSLGIPTPQEKQLQEKQVNQKRSASTSSIPAAKQGRWDSSVKSTGVVGTVLPMKKERGGYRGGASHGRGAGSSRGAYSGDTGTGGYSSSFVSGGYTKPADSYQAPRYNNGSTGYNDYTLETPSLLSMPTPAGGRGRGFGSPRRGSASFGRGSGGAKGYGSDAGFGSGGATGFGSGGATGFGSGGATGFGSGGATGFGSGGATGFGSGGATGLGSGRATGLGSGRATSLGRESGGATGFGSGRATSLGRGIGGTTGLGRGSGATTGYGRGSGATMGYGGGSSASAGRGLLGDYARPTYGYGAGDSYDDYSENSHQNQYSTDYYDDSTAYKASPAPPSSSAAELDVGLILDMKKQISELTNKLESVGKSMAPPPLPPASLGFSKGPSYSGMEHGMEHSVYPQSYTSYPY